MKYQFLRVLLLALPYETRKKTLQMAGERLYWMAVKEEPGDDDDVSKLWDSREDGVC